MVWSNKHYIRIDTDSRIIHGFSDAFETALNGDICINDHGGYQFRLFPNGEENPAFINDLGLHLWRYEHNLIRMATEKERAAELDEQSSLPSSPLPSLDQLTEENRLLRAQIQAQSDRGDFLEDCIAEMAMQVYGV